MDNIEIEPALKQSLAELEKNHKEFFDKNKMDRIQANNSSLNKIKNLKNDVIRDRDYECAAYLRNVEKAILNIIDDPTSQEQKIPLFSEYLKSFAVDDDLNEIIYLEKPILRVDYIKKAIDFYYKKYYKPVEKTAFVIENKPFVDKTNILNYVLVCDVTDNGRLYYYTGHFSTNGMYSLPVNTNEYTEAMKLSFKDEAEMCCKKLNENNKSFTYHVEEHMYM